MYMCESRYMCVYVFVLRHTCMYVLTCMCVVYVVTL